MSQLATPLGRHLFLSGACTLDDGARGALLSLPDVFRLDVQVLDDDLRLGLRNFSRWPTEESPPGYSKRVSVLGDPLDPDLRPHRHDLRFRLGPLAGEVVIALMRDRAHGRTIFTAQALIEHTGAGGPADA